MGTSSGKAQSEQERIELLARTRSMHLSMDAVTPARFFMGSWAAIWPGERGAPCPALLIIPITSSAIRVLSTIITQS